MLLVFKNLNQTELGISFVYDPGFLGYWIIACSIHRNWLYAHEKMFWCFFSIFIVEDRI